MAFTGAALELIADLLYLNASLELSNPTTTIITKVHFRLKYTNESIYEKKMGRITKLATLVRADHSSDRIALPL